MGTLNTFINLNPIEMKYNQKSSITYEQSPHTLQPSNGINHVFDVNEIGNPDVNAGRNYHQKNTEGSISRGDMGEVLNFWRSQAPQQSEYTDQEIAQSSIFGVLTAPFTPK